MGMVEYSCNPSPGKGRQRMAGAFSAASLTQLLGSRPMSDTVSRKKMKDWKDDLALVSGGSQSPVTLTQGTLTSVGLLWPLWESVLTCTHSPFPETHIHNLKSKINWRKGKLLKNGTRVWFLASTHTCAHPDTYKHTHILKAQKYIHIAKHRNLINWLSFTLRSNRCVMCVCMHTNSGIQHSLGNNEGCVYSRIKVIL